MSERGGERDAAIRIPLRGGDLHLAVNQEPEDGYVTLSDIEADIHVTLPVALLNRLTEVGDVVTIWTSPTPPASSAQPDEPGKAGEE